MRTCHNIWLNQLKRSSVAPPKSAGLLLSVTDLEDLDLFVNHIHPDSIKERNPWCIKATGVE